MKVTVYDTTTGTILRSVEIYNPADASLQAGAGEAWIEGWSDPMLHKVVGKQIVDLSAVEKDALRPPATGDQVNRERARRLAAGTEIDVAGYGTVALEGRDGDKINLSGLKDIAVFRMQDGDTTSLTRFRDRDNVDHMLTPPQIVELWQKGVMWVDMIYNRSWDLKSMNPIPNSSDNHYTDEGYWT